MPLITSNYQIIKLLTVEYHEFQHTFSISPFSKHNNDFKREAILFQQTWPQCLTRTWEPRRSYCFPAKASWSPAHPHPNLTEPSFDRRVLSCIRNHYQFLAVVRFPTCSDQTMVANMWSWTCLCTIILVLLRQQVCGALPVIVKRTYRYIFAMIHLS